MTETRKQARSALSRGLPAAVERRLEVIQIEYEGAPAQGPLRV